MSGQSHHPHIPHNPFSQTPLQHRSVLQQNDPGPIPIDLEDDIPSQPVTLLSIDQSNGLRLPIMDTTVTAEQLAAMTADQKILHLQNIAEKQHQQLQEATEGEEPRSGKLEHTPLPEVT